MGREAGGAGPASLEWDDTTARRWRRAFRRACEPGSFTSMHEALVLLALERWPDAQLTG